MLLEDLSYYLKNAVHRAAAEASPGSLLEVLSIRCHLLKTNLYFNKIPKSFI